LPPAKRGERLFLTPGRSSAQAFQQRRSGLNAVSPDIATQFLDLAFNDANFADRFLLSSWGTLSARMRPLLTETVIRSLAADFSPSDLMSSQRPVSVYLRWPERDLLALSPLVGLLWGTLIDELIITFDKRAGKNCNPVLLLIDEAGRTAIPSLADHSTTVVGRGVSLWIAVQSLSPPLAPGGQPIPRSAPKGWPVYRSYQRDGILLVAYLSGLQLQQCPERL
jgi:hypothetical protein